MKRTLIIFLVIMLIPTIALCSTTKVLDKDTDLPVQGAVVGLVTFKQGTTVELNESGEVISGVLKLNKELYCRNSWYSKVAGYSIYVSYGRISIKGGDAVTTFDEHGYVISGTLNEDADLIVVQNSAQQITLKYETPFAIDNNGNLLRGFPRSDTYLRPVGWQSFMPKDHYAGFVKFKAVTEITFGPNGEVVRGTIADQLTVNGITYPAGTTLQFSQSGYSQRT